MTRVKIFKDASGNILKYTIEGHTGYAEAGEDIICSSISILSHTTYVSLIKLCEIPEEDLFVSVRESDGYMCVNIPKYVEAFKIEKAQLVFQVMEIGLKELLESYPEYITLEYGEVE